MNVESPTPEAIPTGDVKLDVNDSKIIVKTPQGEWVINSHDTIEKGRDIIKEIINVDLAQRRVEGGEKKEGEDTPDDVKDLAIAEDYLSQLIPMLLVADDGRDQVMLNDLVRKLTEFIVSERTKQAQITNSPSEAALGKLKGAFLPKEEGVAA